VSLDEKSEGKSNPFLMLFGLFIVVSLLCLFFFQSNTNYLLVTSSLNSNQFPLMSDSPAIIVNETTQNVKITTTLVSSDGSVGYTGTCAGSLVVKNGIVTGCI